MAARTLKLFVLLGLVVAICAGRSHQQSRGEHASSQSPTTVVQGPLGHCDAVLLSSLATFVTSGAGYAYVSTPRQLQLRQQGFTARSLNSSSGATASNSSTGHNANFDPTPPHKPLWPSWSTRDVWLFVLSAVTLFIAAGGGIGGGAVFVPLFIIVGGFTAAQAVALSNITILGGAVANFIANSRKRHAFRNTPLIDWDLIMVMEPTTMLGALLGSYTNKLFPTWFTSCLMAALLVLLTWKLLMRGITTFVHETNERTLHLQHQHAQQGSDDLSAPLLAHAHDQDAASACAADTAAGAGSAYGSSKQHMAVDGVSAWMDAEGAGDQCPAAPAQYSSRGSDTGRVSQHSNRSSDSDSGPSAAADVLPVPAGLRPIAVSTDSTAAAGAALQRDTPRSGRSFSVEGTPKLSERRASQEGRVTSPILWYSPSSAAAATEAADTASCPYSNQAATQHKFQHQQQRRQALLLPRHSAGGSSGDGSANKQESRMCSLCSCLDPTQLKLSTVQAYARQQLPWQPVLILFLLSCWVVASDTGKATLACGSLRYWAVVLSVVPPCLLVTLVVRQWLLARGAVEAAAAAAVGSASPAPAAQLAGAALQQQQQRKYGMIHWTPRNSITYPLICSLAGVFAGLFGVGGGIVKGPLMLELGVLPDVAAATSATMIMFTAGSAAIVYVNFGGVVRDYAQALLLLGFVVTLAGQLVATHLVKVLKRRSIIIFAMGLLMLLASVAAIYQMGLSAVTAYQHPPMWKWGTICQHR